MTSTEPTWNVMIPVVSLVRAATDVEALRLARSSLEKAGFTVYEGDYPVCPNAFEAEDPD